MLSHLELFLARIAYEGTGAIAHVLPFINQEATTKLLETKMVRLVLVSSFSISLVLSHRPKAFTISGGKNNKNTINKFKKTNKNKIKATAITNSING